MSARQGTAVFSEPDLHLRLHWVQTFVDSGIDDEAGSWSAFLDSDINGTSDPRESITVLGSTSPHALASTIVVQVDEVVDISLPQSARPRLEIPAARRSSCS
jgi:hypothetical protein